MEDVYLNERLVGIVMAHGGLDRPAAEAAIDGTISAFALIVGRDAAEALASELPPRFAAAARSPQVPAGESSRAREEVAVVCRALAEILPEEVAERLRAALPAEWAGWLTPPAPPAEPRPHHRPEARSTLAEGKPFSSHPLSEAHVERAHSQSVVRSDNPHGDTKLSGARDPRDEEGEPVSTGKPGSLRPLSEAKE